MPIRTNRGRAAVYRRLWGWPMRSPRHLAIVVFVVAALVIAAGILVPRLTGSNGRPTGGAVAGTSGSSSSSTTTTVPTTPGGTTPGAPPVTNTLPTRITTVTETPKSAAPAQAALTVAESWGKAWVNHPEGVTNEQWLEDLRPLTDEEFLNTEMISVEPANIVATKVTGPPTAVESFTSSVKVQLPTDDGNLLITVIKTGQGWRVSQYEQVD